MKSSHVEDVKLPTTMLTQIGIQSCIPKLEPGETKVQEGYVGKDGNYVTITRGYSKRREKKHA